jgi:hypothetical protein
MTPHLVADVDYKPQKLFETENKNQPLFGFMTSFSAAGDIIGCLVGFSEDGPTRRWGHYFA